MQAHIQKAFQREHDLLFSYNALGLVESDIAEACQLGSVCIQEQGVIDIQVTEGSDAEQ